MASLVFKDTLLGPEAAKHLLYRTTFFVTPERIQRFQSLRPDQALDELMDQEDLILSEGPLSYSNGAAFLTVNQGSQLPGSIEHLLTKSWIIQELARGRTIRQKLAFFNHTLFITDFGSPTQAFDYWRLMMNHANGNLKELAYRVTLNQRMLIYLNNRINTRESPNENYAREFLELFTIRKGPQIGKDDYTHYTEQDVRQAARVLTGFTDIGRYPLPIDPDTGLQTGFANIHHHDTGDKTFSHAFGGKTIKGAQDEEDMYRELQDFIDMIFDQMETARSFVRRMYRYFVSDLIHAEIERDIISPLAVELKNQNYEMAPTLRRLLTSKHFYDEDNHTYKVRGAKIKSGMELMFTSFNMLYEDNIPDPYQEPQYYFKDLWRQLKFYASSYGLKLMMPDNVEGYGGFYKGPNYSQNWINGMTIMERMEMGKLLITSDTIIPEPLKLNLVQYVRDHFDRQEDAQRLVDQVLDTFLVVPPDAARRQAFKELFLGNASEEDWHMEWSSYMAWEDESYVLRPLQELFTAVMSSPDYQVF